jgi:hypothetical protein
VHVIVCPIVVLLPVCPLAAVAALVIPVVRLLVVSIIVFLAIVLLLLLTLYKVLHVHAPSLLRHLGVQALLFKSLPLSTLLRPHLALVQAEQSRAGHTPPQRSIMLSFSV